MVLVSAIGALLDSANIHHLVLDQNMSIIEGSLGACCRGGSWCMRMTTTRPASF
ncbi:hypothetical protein ACVIW0_001820 [Bradyrhizobium sp. USDA 4454]